MRRIIFFGLVFTTMTLKAQTNCHVLYNFNNTPLEEVLTSWGEQCRIPITFDKAHLDGEILSGNNDIVTLKNGLDLALRNSKFSWRIMGDSVIEVVNNIDYIEYIKVNNKFKNTPLEKVLTIWKFNYKLDLDYNLKDVKGIKIFGILKDEPLDIAFSKILASTPLDFKIEGAKHVTIFKPTTQKRKKIIGKVNSNVTISGIIKDQDSGESLPYATVMVKGTTIGTTTNMDGLFTLIDVPTDTSILELSYLGYLTKEAALYPDLELEDLNFYLNSGGVEIQEITVTAIKKDQILKQSGISKIAMTPEIAGILPSYGEKDIFRSLQLLPGISGSNESSSGLYVRGGTPDQNLIMLDGFTVYHVDHLFGFFSAFNSNSIKDVQLYKGGFESKFGGRLSSVVDMTGKDGNSEQFNLGVNLSLLSANGFVESPFLKGKGSFIVTARRSFQSSFYNNLFDSFTSVDDQTEEAGPAFGGRGGFGRFGQTQAQPNSYFYDLNAKMTYRFSKKDKISLSFYNGEDDLDNSRTINDNSFGGGRGFGGAADFSFENSNVDVSNWGNVGASLKWSRQWKKKFFTNTVISYSNYFSKRDQYDENNITRSDTTIVRKTGSVESNDLKDVTLKIDNEYRINQNNKLDFGLQITNNDIKYNYTQNDTITLINRDNMGITAAFYLQDKITLFDRLILTGGARVNYYSPTQKTYVEPRANFTFLANQNLKIKGAYGIYNQFATRVVREDIQQGSRDFWILADDDLIPTSQAKHYIFGASYDTRNYLFDVELFYKDYNGLSEYTTRFVANGFGPNRSLELSEQFYTGTGTSKGAEFLVQKKFGKFSGWLGYTLSQVEYDFPDFGEETFYANQDSRHEFKAVASYRWKKFDVSSTFVYATGRPYTAPVGFYELTLLDGNVEPYFQVSDKNALRYPAYHRWDVSANYNFNLGSSKAKIGASIFNVYNRNNTWYKEYDVVEGQLLETNVSLLGLTPSLFFSWSLR